MKDGKAETEPPVPAKTPTVLASFRSSAKLFTEVRELSDDEARRALDAVQALYRNHNEMQIMLMVMQNQRAFDSAHQEFESELRSGTLGEARLRFVILETNRHLMNALASFVMFLDHAAADLTRRYGNPSPELDRFTKERSALYESVFAYRFLSKLRNYALHCKLPLQAGHATTEIGKEPQLTVMADIDELMQWDGWKRIRNELAERKSLDFHDLLRQVVRCVQRLMGLRNEIAGEDIRTPLAFLEGIRRECEPFGENPCLLPREFGRQRDTSYRIHWLPIDLMIAFRSGLDIVT